MDFFNKKYVSQNVLTLLFVIYLILGLNTPKPIAQVIDTLVEFNEHIACLELECKVKDEMIRNLLMKIIKK